jgi:hypothetical protein
MLSGPASVAPPRLAKSSSKGSHKMSLSSGGVTVVVPVPAGVVSVSVVVSAVVDEVPDVERLVETLVPVVVDPVVAAVDGSTQSPAR